MTGTAKARRKTTGENKYPRPARGVFYIPFVRLQLPASNVFYFKTCIVILLLAQPSGSSNFRPPSPRLPNTKDNNICKSISYNFKVQVRYKRTQISACEHLKIISCLKTYQYLKLINLLMKFVAIVVFTAFLTSCTTYVNTKSLSTAAGSAFVPFKQGTFQSTGVFWKMNLWPNQMITNNGILNRNQNGI